MARPAFRPGALGRLGSLNPYRAAAGFAVRRPRAALLLVGGAMAIVALFGLMVLTSIQAFLAINSDTSTRSRLSQFELGVGVGADGAIEEGAFVPLAAGAAPRSPVTADEVVSVYGIRVHTSIANNLRQLLDAAEADGINLSGWGWRSHEAQIRLRREHCGTSRYAIYEMPSSRCRPPTARPGRSQHEFGLAIDFTYNGRSISTRRSPGFIWLNANAGRYGFRNLESEPWHWSTTGR